MLYALAIILTLWAMPSYATITCSVTAAGVATDPGTVTYTVPAQSNRVVFIAILDRTEAEADPTVTDNNGGTWTKRDGAHSSVNNTVTRVWWYEQTTLGGTGSTTVSVDWSAAINSVLIAGSCYSDTAALSYVSAAAANDETNQTAWNTNAISFTNTGVMLCYTGHNNNTGPNTVNSANTTELNTSSARAHVYARLESSGSNACDITMSGAASGIFGAVLYQEAGSTDQTFGFRRRGAFQ